MRRPISLAAWEDEPVVNSLAVLANPVGRPLITDAEGDTMAIYLPDSVRHFYPRRREFTT